MIVCPSAKSFCRACGIVALLVTVLVGTVRWRAEARFDGPTSSVVTVSAASFEGTAVAPEAIVAGFGSGFATQTIAGNDTNPTMPGVQLPLELGGTSVEVNGRRAELLFVSPGQINYIIPTGTESGPADVAIRRNQTLTAAGSVQIASVSPGVFTANSDGNGWAAAQIVRLRGDQTLSPFEPVVQYDQASSRFVALPIDLGPMTERVFLVIFATGVRRAPDLNGDGNHAESVRVLLGGDQLTPFYAGNQPDYVGLDQINVELPRTLIGRGELSFSVAVSGFSPSNLAQIVIAGPPSVAMPRVSGFGVGAALAGSTLLINGTGFSPVPSDNLVRIGGIEAQVMTSTTTQLNVIVPFGATSGAVRVRTPVGEGSSSSQLQVRTSISGFVENTAREPMGGVRVRLAESSITAETSAEGTFVLADVPIGSHLVDIEGESVQTTPPYPKVTLKITAVANQDNQFVGPISLQQATGGSGNVSAPGQLGEEFTGGHGSNSVSIVSGNVSAKRVTAPWQTQPAAPTPIQVGDFSLVFPANVDATFPNGAKEGKLFLTQLDQSRVAVDLPRGIFSSSIAQITPFNVQFNPGVKLVFPNSDRLPAGSTAKLFRYDQTAGQFVEEPLGATVSADGKRIETAANAIKRSSYYFVARPTQTAVISGRVLDADRRPVRRAVVSLRGQEIFTDGNGGFVLRYVPIFGEEQLTLDASFQRPSGRVDRTRSLPTSVTPNSPAKFQDILLPPSNENRPPVILGPLRAAVSENEQASLTLNISDPDGNPIPRVTLTGPDFATLISPTVAAPIYEIRLAPDFRDSGVYPLIIDAFDVFGASTRRIIQLTVNNVNRLPVASNQSVVLDEDKSLEISLSVIDPDDDLLSFFLLNSPEHGTVSGSGSVITYTPTRDYSGTDRFTYKVNDGSGDSNIATVSITIRAANDPPRLTVPEVSSVREGERLSFTVIANDPDPGQNLTFASENLPLGATFTPISATNAVFSWQPSFRQAGIYNFNLVVTDNGTPPASATRTLRLVVYDTRRDLTTEPAELTILGRTNGEAFGASVAVGDLDHDGVGDLVAGAPYEANNGGIGRVRVFFGAERREGNVDLMEQSADVIITGETNGDRFGAALAVGDFNGDGKADLAIGAPRADDINRTDAGAVYVIFGPLKAGTFEATAIMKWLAVGAHAGDQFGATLGAGDISGDQKVDLVIGAPNFGTIIQGKPIAAAGAIYSFFGGPSFKDVQDLAFVSAHLTLTGIIPDSRLGSALAVGDFNGDGKGDLVAGAPLADLAKKDQGLVYYFIGGTELKGSKTATEAAKFELPGQDAGDNFGAALAFGDFNSDGRLDLIVGAPGGAGPNNLRPLAGEVLIYLGTNSMEARPPNTTIYGSSNNPGSLGANLAVGDFTGDGIIDLALGAPTLEAVDGQPPSTGAVYLIFGAARTPSLTIDLATRSADLTIIGSSAGDQIGLGGMAIGDLDLDLNGIGELIIGVPRGASRNDARPQAGEVHVLRGINRQ